MFRKKNLLGETRKLDLYLKKNKKQISNYYIKEESKIIEDDNESNLEINSFVIDNKIHDNITLEAIQVNNDLNNSKNNYNTNILIQSKIISPNKIKKNERLNTSMPNIKSMNFLSFDKSELSIKTPKIISVNNKKERISLNKQLKNCIKSHKILYECDKHKDYKDDLLSKPQSHKKVNNKIKKQDSENNDEFIQSLRNEIKNCIEYRSKSHHVSKLLHEIISINNVPI